jgi:hypothetical protein
VCVETAVWRHIVVPGVSELQLFRRLESMRAHGLLVALWPQKDRYDLTASVPATGWEKRLDVKDYGSASSLADKLRKSPPAARTIVIPDYRGHAQRDELTELLPGLEIMFVSEVIKQAKSETRKAKRQ